MTKNYKNLQLEIFYLFILFKFAIYLSLGFHKGGTIYRRSLQPPKREHPALQNMKILYFFPLLRIHDILVWIRIWIRGSMPLTNHFQR
jgi:hypothetical protein